VDEVVKGFLAWGGPGLVIVVLLLVLREVHNGHGETQKLLLAEKDARIRDASQNTAAMLAVSEQAHKVHAEVSRSADLLSKAIERLADITEANLRVAATASTQPQGSRGSREAPR